MIFMSAPVSPITDDDSSPPLAALQWARALQLLKQHGVTGVIVILLAYQLGWLGSAQATMCGV